MKFPLFSFTAPSFFPQRPFPRKPPTPPHHHILCRIIYTPKWKKGEDYAPFMSYVIFFFLIPFSVLMVLDGGGMIEMHHNNYPCSNPTLAMCLFTNCQSLTKQKQNVHRIEVIDKSDKQKSILKSDKQIYIQKLADMKITRKFAF